MGSDVDAMMMDGPWVGSDLIQEAGGRARSRISVVSSGPLPKFGPASNFAITFMQELKQINLYTDSITIIS